VDDPRTLESVLATLGWIQERLPLLLPLHPRTRHRLEESSLLGKAKGMPNLELTDPMGYLDFLALTASAKLVLTDSGGLQEETTVLGIPCLTLRESTERPVTVSVGTNIIVGSDPETIRHNVEKILAGRPKSGTVPDLWDGRASERVAEALMASVRPPSLRSDGK
jgi:UDP-N-acetylglucosamine 2-epimerase (non-hydrolysing)